MTSEENIVRKLRESRNVIQESEESEEVPEKEDELEESSRINEGHPNFNDDNGLQKYVGKPLKNLLKDIDRDTKLDIDLKRPTIYGVNGTVCRANQVGWEYADYPIRKLKGGDGKYVDIEIEM